MSFKAEFVSGEYQTMDHTPVSDVAAGDVVVIGSRPCVAHRDIKAGQLGALAIHGGIYKLLKDDQNGPTIAQGEEVAWWNDSLGATDVIGGHSHFGWAVAAAGTFEASVLAFHDPHGATTNTSS